MENEYISILGMKGFCGKQEVFIAFAPSSLLYSHSFADILNEKSGKGYQRRFNENHSLDFRKYIQHHNSTTIPLTFNLRPTKTESWKLDETKNGLWKLSIKKCEKKILSQVDCQHRLGFLSDLDIPLAFMTFIGLNKKEEMRVFNTINGKAKGLSGSLLDFHEAKLANDLAKEKPELFIALRLNDNENSPWYKKLDLGGQKTTGVNRRASLRSLQKAIKGFLNESKLSSKYLPEEIYNLIFNYWKAITFVLQEQWNDPRKNMITKGIGVYALFNLAAYIIKEKNSPIEVYTSAFFVGVLSDFINEVDWSNKGAFKGLGGQTGVKEATNILVDAYKKSNIKLVNHG